MLSQTPSGERDDDSDNRQELQNIFIFAVSCLYFNTSDLEAVVWRANEPVTEFKAELCTED